MVTKNILRALRMMAVGVMILPAVGHLYADDSDVLRSTVRPAFVEVGGDDLKGLKQEKAVFVDAYLAAYRPLADDTLSPREADSTNEALRTHGYLHTYFENGVLNRKKWLESTLTGLLDTALKDFDAAYHELRKPAYRVISIRIGEKPVGVAVYHKEDTAGEAIYLDELAIHPSLWDHKLGSMMVSRDYVKFLYPRAKKLCLATRSLNVRACRFCKQKGFKEVSQVVTDHNLKRTLFTGFELSLGK